MSGEMVITVGQLVGDVLVETENGGDVVVENMGIAGPRGFDAPGAHIGGESFVDLTLIFNNHLI